MAARSSALAMRNVPTPFAFFVYATARPPPPWKRGRRGAPGRIPRSPGRPCARSALLAPRQRAKDKSDPNPLASLEPGPQLFRYARGFRDDVSDIRVNWVVTVRAVNGAVAVCVLLEQPEFGQTLQLLPDRSYCKPGAPLDFAQMQASFAAEKEPEHLGFDLGR